MGLICSNQNCRHLRGSADCYGCDPVDWRCCKCHKPLVNAYEPPRPSSPASSCASSVGSVDSGTSVPPGSKKHWPKDVFANWTQVSEKYEHRYGFSERSSRGEGVRDVSPSVLPQPREPVGGSTIGCFSCHKDRLKCDGKRPVCGPCTHRPGKCDYPFIVKSCIDALENTATLFSPLRLALMSVAAFSLGWQTHDMEERYTAFVCHKQPLLELKTSIASLNDLTSDGIFLTSFFLFIYEIASHGTGNSTAFSEHLSFLLQISLVRRKTVGVEPFPFAIWWICNIDLAALLSGAGSGEFVCSMLNNNYIPSPCFHLYPLGPDGSSLIYPEEQDTLPTLLQLDYEVTTLAARLALLANELRQYNTNGSADSLHGDPILFQIRRRRIVELQVAFRQLWVSPTFMVIRQDIKSLSPRPKILYEHAATLHRACIIYSHTSMWPGQRLEASSDHDPEIAAASNQILQIAQDALNEGRSACRYLVFPIFIAGYASTDLGKRTHAMNYIRIMEKDSIGRNTTTVRMALEAVYDEQHKQLIHTGQSLDVDWREVMTARRLTVDNFGL